LKQAPEIAKELNLNYLVKPRIWINGGKIILSINLMDGPGDKLLETFVYEIDSSNIIKVHLDIIKDITDELDISITPEEQGRIDKVITSNRKALSHYWEGVEYLKRFRNKANLEEAKSCFEKAFDYDKKFASAYAQLAITYYLMDYSNRDHGTPGHEILYSKEINYYADKAFQYDRQLDLSLIAKALYYRNEKKYEFAIDYLEEALGYYPNSYLAIKHLYTLYGFTGNSEESIRYGLKVINSNLPLERTDKELGIEQIYLQLSTSYRSFGFYDKAIEYLEMAEESNPDHIGS
jgi:tetratricopeptide (TPR) repeat protein